MSNAQPSAYQRVRADGERALRSAVLDVAGELLASEGPEALSMRRLATEAGCSTSVLYRLFESKHGIVAGLYREGFDRLRAWLEGIPRSSEPSLDLRLLGQAYRRYALDNPSYYSVMFGRPVPQFEPSADDVAHGHESLAVLASALHRAQEAGELGSGDPWAGAQALWAAAHGVVSLEHAGHLPPVAGERVFEVVTAGVYARLTSGGWSPT